MRYIYYMRLALPAAALLAAASCALSQPARTDDSRLVSDILVPTGCARPALERGSYAEWVRSLPLKPDNRILAHDGRTVDPCFYRVMAVLGLPLLFRDDLEQCADWCFRLWAEYHRQAGRLDRLYLLDYGGKRRPFRASGKTFRSFLRRAMADANSHSLKRGCAAADTSSLLPGDMLVQNRDGGIGHVSVIMDVCQDSSGNRFYLVGYGYMPAQEFHIEEADSSLGRSGWFSLAGYLAYLDRHFDFGRPEPRRFR